MTKNDLMVRAKAWLSENASDTRTAQQVLKALPSIVLGCRKVFDAQGNILEHVQILGDGTERPVL